MGGPGARLNGLVRSDGFPARLADAVEEFGAAVRQPLAAGIGRPEDQIADPVARLVQAAGRALGLKVVTHAETPLSELSIRPDFAVDVADSAVGFIEVKRPGKGADPTAWSARSHDGRQWQKLRLLPNVLYTDGSEWALYRDGERAGPVAKLDGALDKAGRSLSLGDGKLARVLEEFLWRPPDPPRGLRSLVRTAARLCRYLREEVIEVLEYEQTARNGRPFTALAQEWRQLLFPRMTGNARFADAYAQTITFALLLARNAGITFEGHDLPAIGRQLGKQYALIGRALAVLSDPAAADSLLIIETLRRIIGAVDWDQLDATGPDAHATLYETFLQEYDPQLRRLSGSYYTPDRLARSMVRFTDRILREKLNRPWGYANDDVIVVDPAMGTGTFLVEVVDQVAETVAAHQGEGARAQRLRDLFRDRLIGFERQVTPYSVAEMRLHEALKTGYGVDVPEQEMRFLADTFEDPDKQELAFGAMYAELQRQREGANRVKRDVPVMAVIGNPPYLDRAHQRDPAPWIEDRREPGRPADILRRPSLDEFRRHDRLDYKLAATWVFYWRWAIWKAFEAHPDQPAGVVAFITPSSYLTGAAFARMRSYMRRVADEVWIIDVSPERHQPPVPTRIFPTVQQPLCIAVLVRRGPRSCTPARVYYRAVTGTREEKLRLLDHLRLSDPAWQECQGHGEEPFIPATGTAWSRYPSLGDIFPWQSPGVKANRTWVIAPHPDVLKDRWEYLISSDPDQRDELLKATRDRTADSIAPPIPGHPQPRRTLRSEKSRHLRVAPYAYRSFDRQYLLLDTRVIDYPRPALWAVDGPRQVFISEPHTNVIDDGPALSFSAAIPDMHYFQGHHGGRVLPLYRDRAATTPNIAPGLLDCLRQSLAREVDAEDLLAYIAAVVAHPGYSRLFARDLTIPGIRVPLSANPEAWDRAITLGRKVISLHTAATAYPDPTPHQLTSPQRPDHDGPQIIRAIPYTAEEMPDAVHYDESNQILCIGSTGQVAPVPPPVWDYRVGGMRVVDKWIRYRLKNPRRRRASSLLDEINATCWTRFFNDDLLDLLCVLERLIRLEPAQDTLLRDIFNYPILDTPQLRAAGVLPAPDSSRHPQDKSSPPGQLAI
jgi:hypothetical protein